MEFRMGGEEKSSSGEEHEVLPIPVTRKWVQARSKLNARLSKKVFRKRFHNNYSLDKNMSMFAEEILTWKTQLRNNYT